MRALITYLAPSFNLGLVRNLLSNRNTEEMEVEARLDQMLRDLAARGLDAYIMDWKDFIAAAQKSSFRLFDPSAWSRRGEEDDEFEGYFTH